MSKVTQLVRGGTERFKPRRLQFAGFLGPSLSPQFSLNNIFLFIKKLIIQERTGSLSNRSIKSDGETST